jgi:uncharacterized membrane protein YhaH (DUF805 family)
VRRLFALWFGLEGHIDRRTYLRHGAFLTALKFAGDGTFVRVTTGQWWTPLDYLSPSLISRSGSLRPSPDWLLAALAAWALPFLWIGVSMSLRRIRDAGLSPWDVLFFFVPLANWVLILVLVSAPSRTLAKSFTQDAVVESRLQAAFKGIASGVVIGLVSFGLQAVLLHSYNAAIFLGTPFTMGAAAGWFYNRPALQPVGRTARLGALAIAIAALGSLLFAFEGLICIAMALPPALVAGMFGAVVGRAIRGEHVASRAALVIAVAVPSSAVLESRVSRPPLREVVTSIEIPAAPEVVWPHVIQFRELSEDPAWFFRRGIAYPTRARIEGTGPGAVRFCEFSTGAFVEPITVWDPPRRLGFDVSAQPAPMREWSPYADLHPPHLDFAMSSRRGEFRLVALPGGRTRLEGSTWYQIALGPQAYWAIWSDLIVHRIHERVLEHIRNEVLTTNGR